MTDDMESFYGLSCAGSVSKSDVCLNIWLCCEFLQYSCRSRTRLVLCGHCVQAVSLSYRFSQSVMSRVLCGLIIRHRVEKIVKMTKVLQDLSQLVAGHLGASVTSRPSENSYQPDKLELKFSFSHISFHDLIQQILVSLLLSAAKVFRDVHLASLDLFNNAWNVFRITMSGGAHLPHLKHMVSFAQFCRSLIP